MTRRLIYVLWEIMRLLISFAIMPVAMALFVVGFLVNVFYFIITGNSFANALMDKMSNLIEWGFTGEILE